MPDVKHARKKRTIRQIIRGNLRHPARPDPSPETLGLAELEARPTSMVLRHLDCGSCNGCELQLNALSNPCYDSERYGIGFESSPRHANYLAMTGPFTRGLAEAARLTREAMPEPAIIAVGDCAIDGGPFRGSYALNPRPVELARQGNDKSLIRLEISGCPPSPAAILRALAGLAMQQGRVPVAGATPPPPVTP
ncbi:MAG TPA: hydrogenase [Lamprocystis sp. (in: g-proteobacteria)]|nr:hydrogenase [Lamprocystis sp. (in: g-proteobacteria)]